MRKRKYDVIGIPTFDMGRPENKALTKIELSLNIMDYLNRSTKTLSDEIYSAVVRGAKYVK